MIFFSWLRRFFAGSLAFRWVLYVTFAAGIGIAALLAATHSEMEHQLNAEGALILDIARQKTGERMDAEIELVRHRVVGIVQNLESSATAIAELRSTLLAVQSLNDVRIAEEVGKRLVNAGFTGAIVLGKDMSVLAAEETGAALLAAHSALQVHELRTTFAGLLAQNDRTLRRSFRFVGLFDASLSAILQASLNDDYGALVASPVFDEFGDPVALIVGYRIFRRKEPRLDEFAEITKSVLALTVGSRVVSIAGADIDHILFRPADKDGLIPVPDLSGVARCRETFPLLSICVVHANSEIERFRNELLVVGRKQFDRSRATLMSIGGLSVTIILLMLIGLGRHLTRPLSQITQAVDLVSRGEWRVEVGHTERQDEIGRIARAVAAMQVSLAERDRMRQEMVRIDAINQRRMVLDAAVVRFEDGMAVVMKNISDTVRALAETNETLDAAARQADSQVEKIRSTSMATATRATVASRSTLEMSRTIRDIAQRVRNTSNVVHQGEKSAREAEERLAEIAAAAHGAEGAIHSLQDLVADLNKVGLRASLDAVAAGEAGGIFMPISRSISELAGKATTAAGHVTEALGRLSDVADDAGAAIITVKGELGEALRETAEISVAIEEQDAVTRDIADGLNNAAGALLALSEAVDMLRVNMMSTQEASTEFVATARRIAEDAKQIDTSIRSFVNEVVA